MSNQPKKRFCIFAWLKSKCCCKSKKCCQQSKETKCCKSGECPTKKQEQEKPIEATKEEIKEVEVE